jgi:hypothetical protein
MPKQTPDTNQTKKQLTIDIDKELELLKSTGLRDGQFQVVEEPIYIGDNDEVSFKGDELKKRSPLKIKVGSKKEIDFSGDRYTIKTAELKDGDFITIRDKNGEVFVDVKVIKN